MNPIVTLIPKIAKWTEILGIVITGIGIIFKVLNYPGFAELLMIGLLTLSATYFLSAYMVVQDTNDKEKKGLADVLPFSLRKFFYMGLSIYWIAFLLAILHLSGADEMLIFGLGTLLITTFVAMILVLGNRERMKHLQAPLVRTVITLLIYFALPLFR